MRTMTCSIAFSITLALTSLATAQDPKLLKPQPEHEWLRRFVGQWDFAKKSTPKEGQPTIVGRGEVSATMLGKFFVLSQWKGDLYNAEFQANQTLGYSVVKKKCVGTWIDSFMSHQWHFEGDLDMTKKELVVIAKGPGSNEQDTEFRETYQILSEHEIVVIAEMKQDDEWVQFMTTELNRKKSE